MPDYWEWPRYISVAERKREAQREQAALRKKGRALMPVVIAGSAITRTFWGKAWCKNLESYSDYANRLPRGRSYVRGGLVLHLEIAAGAITALVRGSSLYNVTIGIAGVPKAQWKSMCDDSAGAIDSLVELLQGRFSEKVMARLCLQRTGLFPAPSAITLACSCPDSAAMCKHIAAVMYGVGARLDEQPELLFRLRQVDEKDLIRGADAGARLVTRGSPKHKVLAKTNLAELFGLPMAAESAEVASKKPRTKRAAMSKRGAGRKKAGARKVGGRKRAPLRRMKET